MSVIERTWAPEPDRALGLKDAEGERIVRSPATRQYDREAIRRTP